MMLGVVRVPSAFSITLVLPFSMMATQELVVPRSIPMIFPMMLFLSVGCLIIIEYFCCLAVFHVGDDGRRGARTFRVFDHFGLAVFHDGDAGVSRAQVNSEDFSHDAFPFSWVLD